jgi:hypothetical protein
MGKLSNPKHESFCHAIELDGKHPQDAYVVAGYEPNRANHNRLLNRADIKARLVELAAERELVARAARTPTAEVLAELAKHGIDRVADFFEFRSSDILAIRDLTFLRPEVALSLLNTLHDGTGLKWDPSTAVQRDDLLST